MIYAGHFGKKDKYESFYVLSHFQNRRVNIYIIFIYTC